MTQAESSQETPGIHRPLGEDLSYLARPHSGQEHAAVKALGQKYE